MASRALSGYKGYVRFSSNRYLVLDMRGCGSKNIKCLLLETKQFRIHVSVLNGTT